MAATSILILSMGSTLPALRARRGDFSAWIAAGLGVPAEVIDVAGGAALPPARVQRGVVITGSHTMVTERQDWSERSADWLRDAVAASVPVLGICYGHQLLAHAHGGEVGDNPRGREFGTVEITFSEAAGQDPLVGPAAPRTRAHVGHTQSVLKLPPDAIPLASSERDAYQAFRLHDRAWGVQFHPEFDAEITRAYVHHYAAVLAAEGQDTGALLRTVAEAPRSAALLPRFAALCRE